jgi:hypothetical protein
MPTTDNNKQLVWPGQSMARQLSISAYDEQPLTTINIDTYETTKATIPANTPDGEYILRVEQIALHMASQPNKAQFYLACSQIQITGGGNGTPGPLVALPGAYSSNDPGILVNIYSIQPDSYKPPGPAVWSG